MSRIREVDAVHHSENFLEQATNDAIDVQGERGYWEVTVEDTDSGATATGTGSTKAEAHQNAVDQLS